MNAYVMAGGQSTRMGRDKALLPVAGVPLIVRALDLLRSVGLTPRICGSRPDLGRFAEVIRDNFPRCGPLAGIEAALASSDSELNLFLSVDLPLLPASFIAWLTERAATTQAVATVPVIGDRPQPLCAAYSRRLIDGIGRALAAGDFKVIRVIEAAAAALREPVDRFDVEAVAAALAPGEWPASSVTEWFRNVNTPADYELLTSAIDRQSVLPGVKSSHPIS